MDKRFSSRLRDMIDGVFPGVCSAKEDIGALRIMWLVPQNNPLSVDTGIHLIHIFNQLV